MYLERIKVQLQNFFKHKRNKGVIVNSKLRVQYSEKSLSAAFKI